MPIFQKNLLYCGLIVISGWFSTIEIAKIILLFFIYSRIIPQKEITWEYIKVSDSFYDFLKQLFHVPFLDPKHLKGSYGQNKY